MVLRRYRQLFNDSDETLRHQGRMLMKSGLSLFAGIALATLLPTIVQAQEPVRLGFLSSMSGTFGVLGAEQKRGMDIALEHLGNKLGGRPVKLIEVDDKSSPVE